MRVPSIPGHLRIATEAAIVIGVVLMCIPTKVTQPVVAWFAIPMATLHAIGARSDEGFQDDAVNAKGCGFAIAHEVEITVGTAGCAILLDARFEKSPGVAQELAFDASPPSTPDSAVGAGPVARIVLAASDDFSVFDFFGLLPREQRRRLIFRHDPVSSLIRVRV